MKRILRSGVSASSEQQSSSFDADASDTTFSTLGFVHRIGRSHSLGERTENPMSENALQLPSAWTIPHEELRCSDPSSIRIFSRSPSLKTTIYADVPLPSPLNFLQSEMSRRTIGRTSSGRNVRDVRRGNGEISNGNNGSDFYPTLVQPAHQSCPLDTNSTKIYYYEVTITVTPSRRRLYPGEGSPAIVDVMIGFVQGESHIEGILPGEIPGSIGWGSNGLYVNGQRLSLSDNHQFFNGDIIGCGIEMGRTQRAFFTRNGTLVVPPHTSTAFIDESRCGGSPLNCYPVIAFQHAAEQGVLKSNFGLDSTFPFRWLGNEWMASTSNQHGGHVQVDSTTNDLGNLLTRPGNLYNARDIEVSVTTRNAAFSTASSIPTPNTTHVTIPTNIIPGTQYAMDDISAIYGTQNSTINLEGDDPTAVAISEHFNVVGGNSSSSTLDWMTTGNGMVGNELVSPNQGSPSSFRRLDSSRRKREEGGQPRRESSSASSIAANGRKGSEGAPGNTITSSQAKTSCQHQSPSDPISMNERFNEHIIESAVTHVAGRELLKNAKDNSNSLLAVSKKEDADFSEIRRLLDQCNKDQQQLQMKLNTALEESVTVDNLEELFAVNDTICSAIEAGKSVLKRDRGKKKKFFDGPTVDVLVENQDIFSLICTLRATGEQRLRAALALMNFAKNDPLLRNEIRSSGGMHSFLTLFRTKGVTRELQVVTSMAVVHTLPSFVSSSQTSPSVGLKIMECLRFLVTANSVSPNGTHISKEEMCRAASVGVNVLWINAIQPLLTMEKVKRDSQNVELTLNSNRSMRPGRPESRSGGGVFDQGLESMEIQELTESAVILIAYLVKLTNANQLRIDLEYGIVEQICEVDQARPIAVREGLLAVFVEWIRSGDINKIRPAASALRYLISTNDSYMAGWIHSQVVNEGAIREIVKLLNQSVGHDVRVAVSQMLSALCIAPHTRAAVIEANCVSYLIALLYEHTSPDSEEMVYCAGNALLQLAACSMTRSHGASNFLLPGDPDSTSQTRDVVNEIVEGWAHGSFVHIALKHTGKLRSVSVEALRVLSEDTSPSRKTRLHLCGAGAAEALGATIKSNELAIKALEFDEHNDIIAHIGEEVVLPAIKDTYEALRALANILEPPKSHDSKMADIERSFSRLEMNPKELLVKGCVDVAKSGGLSGILRVSSMPIKRSSIPKNEMLSLERTDLLEEACRLLANLSPLLLSDVASSGGVTRWAIDVLDALDGILKRLNRSTEGALSDEALELYVDATKGIMALAIYEPLKIHIVNRTLPRLLFLRSTNGDQSDLSTSINQVLLSLGFTEDEITVQIAGNNPQLLVDWFCLQRSLLLQAMARAEIRTKLRGLWQLPLSDGNTEKLEEMNLIRQLSQHTETSMSSSCDPEDDPVMKDLFANFTNDYDSQDLTGAMRQQYFDVYEQDSSIRKIVRPVDVDGRVDPNEDDLTSLHVYPLNDINEERDWILDHRKSLSMDFGPQKFDVSGTMPMRVEKLLETCFPSRIMRNHIIPVNDLRPESSFNFRALMMPKRRFFSFRREGQLVARLCDKQAKDIDSDDVHWTLGFSNSTFAGEFIESLVQTLYLCPMIRGLSFVRTIEWTSKSGSDIQADADDGGGLLANLTGSLPPWVSFLTFDNMLCDRDLRALVAIIDTIGRLSAGQEDNNDFWPTARQSQGKFSGLSIRNSPQINRDVWMGFFQTLGKLSPSKRQPLSSPLSSLKILDLSGNKIGDEAAALVLELVHDKDSGCNLEQLDLSGNRIGRGTNVVRVLCAYTEYYRYNQTVGCKIMRKGWKSSLHTLILAENDLFLGQAGLEILALLKHNALCLRCLDLSNNSLEGDSYQLLASSLLKNTALCHLNLSGNKFSPALVDLVLEHLNADDAESGLSLFLLENNTPSLNESHRKKLATFLRRSRKNAIERYIKESETDATDMDGSFHRHGGDLDLIDEDTRKILARTSISAGQPEQFSHVVPGEDTESEQNKITVLFSAPLVFSSGKNELHPFAKLDFEMERELLWQCMKEASRDIEMSFDNAHHSRLLATLTRRCSVLHYSGHGHPAFLPFEDGMGGPNWLDVQDIKELILQDGVVPFKFVFVSACHSGLAGETFASAGVPHVVCCKQESELKDTAALAFTRSFYLALLVGHTVKESFEQGCKAVRATPNLKDPDKEMEKFILLPKNGNHNVPVFQAKAIREWPKQPRHQRSVSQKFSRRRGSRGSLLTRIKSTLTLGAKSSELSVRNMMQEDPSPTAPQFFLGREVDMYYVISALLKLRKRLVTIYGETGIGRSSLACSVCHYINERASTIPDIQHIYFIKPKHGGQNVSCRSILRQLLDKLEDNGKCRPADEDADTEAMLNIICRSLKQDKCLIVFDRTELLEKSDESQELPMILSTILYETKQVKVIVTARAALGQASIGGQVEHPYFLGPLTYSNTVKLFANLCPHLHTPSERGQLFKALVRDEDQEDLLPGAATINDRTKHIFPLIGNGIPAKIEKCAYSISPHDLSRLPLF
ncbi:NACHT domain containing protein [Nitzschia inconspicua]|uniref:NACHT domain containing protein n=1 Tax=Nitzschia inconspicua TaxID=303405 RepID=A0A9K3LKV9_9STRA|nr:NACHT domain containing protein [Nitzschia inconspicua]